MPASADDQIRRILQPKYSGAFLRGLGLVRDTILEQPVEPQEDSPEFIRGIKTGHELLEQCGDAELALLLIDDILLRAWLERLGV